MHLLDVLYYYYFLFYKKVISDPEPHFATVVGLTFSIGLLVNGSLHLLFLILFCFQITAWIHIVIAILIFYFLFIDYYQNGRAKHVLKKKPTIAKSHSTSIIITLLFVIITSSYLFWGSIYGRNLLDGCK